MTLVVVVVNIVLHRTMAGEDSASLVATGISFALAIISVVMRFYVRVRTKAGLAWDDWWILIGLIMALLTGSLLMWGMLALLCSTSSHPANIAKASS